MKNIMKSLFTVLIFLVLSNVAFANTGTPTLIAATYNSDTGVLSTSGTYSTAPCDARAVGFALFVDGANPNTGGSGSLDGDGTPTMHVLDLPCTESGSWEDNTHTLEEAPESVCVVIYDVHLNDANKPKDEKSVTPAGNKHNGDNSYEKENNDEGKNSYGQLDCVQPEIINQPRCGDGVVNQQSEQCDDGNNINGDGCSAECQIEHNNDVPEFTTIGAGLVLAGAGAYMYRRRSRK